MPGAGVALIALGVVLALMLAEAALSRRNERWLRARGAVEPPDDVYAAMQWAYPACFIAMAVEGVLVSRPPGIATIVGATAMAASKALKYWAIGTLGRRWTFRVLVVPNLPLIDRGPYAFVRHPNYVAVCGELASMAALAGALVTGPAATGLFVLLLLRRIRVEDRALRHLTCSRAGG